MAQIPYVFYHERLRFVDCGFEIFKIVYSSSQVMEFKYVFYLHKPYDYACKDLWRVNNL